MEEYVPVNNSKDICYQQSALHSSFTEMITNNVFFSFVLNVKILSNLIFSFFKVKLDKLCVISAESVCQQFDVPLLIISYIDVKTLLSPYDIWSMLNSHPFSKDYPTKGRSK